MHELSGHFLSHKVAHNSKLEELETRRVSHASDVIEKCRWSISPESRGAVKYGQIAVPDRWQFRPPLNGTDPSLECGRQTPSLTE